MFSMLRNANPVGDVILTLPLPNVEIDETELNAIKSAFNKDGHRITLRTEDVYPCSGTWGELWFDAGKWVVTAIAAHYGDKILDALDAFVKSKITHIDLQISYGDRAAQCRVELKNREAAKHQIADALREIEIGLTDKDATIYKLRDARILNDGVIIFDTSDWRSGAYRRSSQRISIDSPDYAFFAWILRESRPNGLLTDGDISTLRNEFDGKQKAP